MNKLEQSWLTGGDQAYALMLEAIGRAKTAIRLETYIFTDSPPGQAFRTALVGACRRGVKVRIMIDGWGSLMLPDAFWGPLLAAGGEVRIFNPLSLGHITHRDHRKLLVCDQSEAFIGGFNIMAEEAGDGITSGWCDLGLRLQGPVVADLAITFDDLWATAEQRQPLIHPIRWRKAKIQFQAPALVLASGPAFLNNPIRHALLHDLHKARQIQIVAAYFLPVWRLRRALFNAARQGRHVQLLLAGKSDVPLARQASHYLYHRFLRAGIEIFEYQPQILHTKLVRADTAVYVGSANLDTRSLNINYELLVRLQDSAAAAQAEELFGLYLRHSRRIDPQIWRKERSLLEKLKEWLAYLILGRLDPYVARLNLGHLR